MHCPHCGTSLSQNTTFCSLCGNLMYKPNGEAERSEHVETLPPTPLPYDPYYSQPSTYYGAQTSVVDKQSPYTSPTPPPHRRSSPAFLKGLFIGILVILLLSGGLGGWLLLKQEVLSPSVHHSVSPTVTPQTPVASDSSPTVTPQTPVPAANTTSQFLPGTWTQCAVENATCTFSGTMTVAFGANGSFHYATKSNGTACTNAIFGDPLNGTTKACYTEAAPPTTNVWIQCAAENATCSFLGTMTMAFGAGGSYKYATETNGSACTIGAFGDPLYGTVKSCYLISPPTSAARWNACAAQNSTCSFTGRREVAYGANGAYFYGSFTNGTACNSVFGDPAPGVVKTCYYQE